MKISIPNNWFHQFLFILSIAVPYLDNFELTISVWTMVFLLTIQMRYSFSFLSLIIPYVLILLIATIVSFNFEYEKYLIVRDITYLCKPMIGFFLGYQLCRRNFQNAFRLLVKAGTFIAICHIIVIINAILIVGVRNVADLRSESGYFSDYEIYTLIILLFPKQFQLDYSKRTLRTLTLIVGFSAFMYLARTNFIQFVILFLAVKGYFVITKKSLSIILSIIVVSVVGYSIVVSTNPRRNAEGLEGFLYKIKVAPMEPFKSKINRDDYKDFNDNYRSYENIMTIRQVTRDGLTPTIFGKGLGSQIDLKQEVWLGDMNLRFISILHNGFMIVFLKSGLLGICIYMFTIIFFFRKIKTDKPIVNAINLLFIGTGIFLFVSNWVFLGFYNLTESKTILIGFLIAYREKINQQ